MDARIILDNVRQVSARFAAERRERQRRQGLVGADFAHLREAGFPLVGVPVDHGGIWESVRRSTRPLCELLRTLAHGDSSVALVCAMHPTVLVFWMANSQVAAPFQAAWEAQRRHIFQTVREGAWWGTVSSEPGSGGDLGQDSGHRTAWAEGWSLTGTRTCGHSDSCGLHGGWRMTISMHGPSQPRSRACIDTIGADMMAKPGEAAGLGEGLSCCLSLEDDSHSS